MEVRITQTTPVYRNPNDHGVFVQWDIEGPPASGIDYFTLERSGSLEGPFEMVIEKLFDFHYFDKFRETPAATGTTTRENLNFLSLNRTVYYRVTAVPNSGDAVSVVRAVGPNIISRKLLLLRRKMLRDFSVALKFSGVDLVVLKRRHWGERCEECFEPLTKKVLNSKCEECYGTGFKEGYFSPVKVRGRFSVENIQSDITPQGVTDISGKRVTLLDMPKIDERDIVIDLAQNKRYTVKLRHNTEMQTMVVHQVLSVTELARDSVEYRIPVNDTHIPMIY